MGRADTVTPRRTRPSLWVLGGQAWAAWVREVGFRQNGVLSSSPWESMWPGQSWTHDQHCVCPEYMGRNGKMEPISGGSGEAAWLLGIVFRFRLRMSRQWLRWCF